MIENQHQYEITKTQLAKFQQALQELKPDNSIHPLLQKAQRDAVQSIIDELSKQIREYKNEDDE